MRTYKFINIKFFAILLIGIVLIGGCRKKTNPELTLNGAQTMDVNMNGTFNDPGANAIDYKGRDISSSIKKTGTVIESSPGAYTVIYSVSDKKGNSSTLRRKVNVNAVNSFLVGDYTVSDSTLSYIGTITKSSGEKGIIFSKLWDFTNISGTLTGKEEFIITSKSENGNTIYNDMYSAVTNPNGVIIRVNYKILVVKDSTSSVYENHTAIWTKK